MLRELVQEQLRDAVRRLSLHCDEQAITLTVPDRPEFGALSTTVAFYLARVEQKPPRQIAEEIASTIQSDAIAKVEVAGQGYINFYLRPEAIHMAFQAILAQGPRVGKLDVGKGQRALVEFVSANPTGPLTVGHCRQAVLGDALCRLSSYYIGVGVHHHEQSINKQRR